MRRASCSRAPGSRIRRASSSDAPLGHRQDEGAVQHSGYAARASISPGLPGCSFAPRCRYAKEKCAENPPLAGDRPAHPYACFFPVRGPHAADAPVPSETDAEDHPEAERITSLPATVRSGDRDGAPEGGAPSSEDAPVLVLEHVVKEFPIFKGVLQRRVGSVQAVSDVSLEIGRGETFALVGESGCGKTTLGRLIVALERPDSGSIRFEGEDVSKLRGSDLRRKRQSFQIMFQDSYASLDPRARVATPSGSRWHRSTSDRGPSSAPGSAPCSPTSGCRSPL